MKAKYWWKIRNLWHYPQFFWMGHHSNHIWWFGYYRLLSLKKYKWLFNQIRRDMRDMFWKYYWGFWYLQPFRCNGNKGGWRTKVCDWLEDKARREEN